MTDWEREKEFWSAPGRVDTYDKEYYGGYSEASEMRLCPRKCGEEWISAGEWVRAEDYRAEVEALEKRIAELTK
jgi:hypothetical protein